MDTISVTSGVKIPQTVLLESNSKLQFSYLSDDSKKDAEWDRWKSNSQDFEKILMSTNQVDMLRYAEKIQTCAKSLLFALEADSHGEIKHRLKNVFFCRFRHCPVCQARRSRRNYAKFLNSLPNILSEYGGSRWIFLTLTVPNVHIKKLRVELGYMNEAWHRLIKRKEFKNVLAWVRSTEITKESKRNSYAHPHFHVLMMVKSTYFKDGYINREKWLEAWRGAMKNDSVISVDVRVADRNKGKKLIGEDLIKSVSETLKYSVKPSDILMDKSWTVELIRQVHKLRFLAGGGLFKGIFSERLSNDEMIHTGENQNFGDEIAELTYWWNPFERKYTRKRKIFT